ncbi:MAG TPA: hypothetical protein VK705_08880 [Ferruginibacter sp.]|jgi:hypothetical protein|nr:hypothetical protein [Ferruginibacter sp.]
MNKKNLCFLTISFLSVVMFTSCKKTSSSSNNNANNSTNINGTLLTEFVELDTLHAATHDTTYRTVFQYDNSKRLNGFINYSYDSSVGTVTDFEAGTLFYNGTNTHPYKSVVYQSGVDTTTSLYSYDGNGNLIYEKDTQSGDNTDSLITLYTYSGPYYSVAYNYQGAAMTETDTVFYQETLVSNDFTSGYYVDGSFTGIVYSGVTYDTHKNPFTAVKSFYINGNQQGPDEEDGYFGASTISVNNVINCNSNTTFNYPTPGTNSVYIASSFVYNSDDYLSSCRFISTTDGYAGIKYFYYTN